MSNKDDNSDKESVKIHQARLRALVQALEKGAEIKISLDRDGTRRLRTYGSTETCDYPLKDLLATVWQVPEDSDYGASKTTISRYFEDFDTITDRRGSYLTEDQLRFILRIVCTFIDATSDPTEETKAKERYFFDYSGYSRFVSPLKDSSLRIADFMEEIFLHTLRPLAPMLNKDSGEYIQYLQAYIMQYKYRSEKLGKKAFRFLQNRAEDDVLESLKENLRSLIDRHLNYIKNMEKEGNLMPDYANYRRLSNPDLELIESEIGEIENLGYEHAFKNNDKPYDGLRYQKLKYWKSRLLEDPVDSWPQGYLAQVLLAEMEHHAASKKIGLALFDIRDDLKYELYFSKDGNKISRRRTIYSIHNLSKLLMDYEFIRKAFTSGLMDDGNLIEQRLQKLPEEDREKCKKSHQTYELIFIELINNYLIEKISNYVEFKFYDSKYYTFK